MSNIFEIIDNLRFLKEESNKLQVYFIIHREERTLLYSALTNLCKTDKNRLHFLKEFLTIITT
ncbi:15902_t:CDS:1, partial [Funneliformis caledonium]